LRWSAFSPAEAKFPSGADLCNRRLFISSERMMLVQRQIVFTTTLGIAPALAAAANAGSIKSSDLIVIDRGNGTLDDVNPTTGASTVIASGFSNPQGLTINAQSMIFVSDIGTSTIDEVNPAPSA
jgi:glucose/arabinose dehydrogenase